MRELPRIMNGPEMAALGRKAVGKLIHVELPQQNGSRLSQSANDESVFLRNSIRKNGAPTGGPDPSGVDQVFQRNGNPVERPAVASGEDFFLGRARLLCRLPGGDCDECVESWIQTLNALQARLGQRDWRYRSRSNAVGC